MENEANEFSIFVKFIDHMACIQKLTSRIGINTLGEMIDELQKFIVGAFKESDAVHVVSKRYEITDSIKAGERNWRGEKVTPEIKLISTQQNPPHNIK